MKIAVIVTTYNRPDALAAVLEGYLAQDDRDFELLVADDGSTDETRNLIEKCQDIAPFPIKHVWQEDAGFRAARIRNLAVAATDASYVIFTDGDCIPAKHFVSSHRKLREPGYFLSGNRVLISEAFTKKVLSEHIPVHEWSLVKWAKARWQGEINRILPLVSLPDCCRKNSPNKWEGAKTCNLSAFREDLIEVNGFDESYTGWGLEDSDLVVRLIRAGIKHKSARFFCPVFHLWHPENDRSRLEENRKKLESILGAIHIRASLGLDQYL
jgi:glycosyltransferase involved in cell wall biosynthesis